MRSSRNGVTGGESRNPQALIVVELLSQFSRIVRRHRWIPLLAGYVLTIHSTGTSGAIQTLGYIQGWLVNVMKE